MTGGRFVAGSACSQVTGERTAGATVRPPAGAPLSVTSVRVRHSWRICDSLCARVWARGGVKSSTTRVRRRRLRAITSRHVTNRTTAGYPEKPTRDVCISRLVATRPCGEAQSSLVIHSGSSVVCVCFGSQSWRPSFLPHSDLSLSALYEVTSCGQRNQLRACGPPGRAATDGSVE